MIEKTYTSEDSLASGSSDLVGQTKIVRGEERSNSSDIFCTGGALSNYDRHFYFELQNAIRKMSDLPGGHYMHLNRELSAKAMAILSVISSNSRVKPPRVINEDGEAVIFTWKRPCGKSYLSVDEEHIDLLEIQDKDTQRVVPLGDHDNIDLKALLAELQDSITSEV